MSSQVMVWTVALPVMLPVVIVPVPVVVKSLPAVAVPFVVENVNPMSLAAAELVTREIQRGVARRRITLGQR
ncbi:MAG: hypothetical protein IPP28_00290 [Xanthomonadales bacterium]|nr:hypothetical protein [Xanthomonadales bacterium]